MHQVGVLHRLAPLLHRTAGVLEACRALRQVLVFQLQARRQQVDHQGVRHLGVGGYRQVHQHQVTALERFDIQGLAIHAKELAADGHATAAGNRGLARITGQGQLLEQRLAAFILDGQR
ncbi:hypothetical protein D3C76_1026810 [compost metagenome]